MLRACSQCRQFFKPDEKSCPHCGRESSWKQVMVGVAAAAMLGGACQKADPPPVAAPLYGAPPREVPKPAYGLPPREAPPPPAPEPDAGPPAPPPDAGVPAPAHKPPGHRMHPMYGVPIRDKVK
ncbi:MAG: hypothetical protein QM723_24190 [Myxococcaceae bacterium]